MGNAVLWTALLSGAVIATVGAVELFSYRRYRQPLVNANILPGTKTT